MTIRKQSVPGLDIARFCAAMMVAIYHLCYWRNGLIPEDTDLGNTFFRFGWIGVQIFFTISGFVIAFSAEGATPNQFANSRVMRLMPTVWICATLTLFTTILEGNSTLYDILENYLATIFLKPVGNHIDIVYWTLTIEVSFYAFIFIMIRFFDFSTFVKAIIIIGLISCIFNLVVAFGMYFDVIETSLFKYFLLIYRKHTARLLLLHHGCFFALGVLMWARTNVYRPKRILLLFMLLIIGATSNVCIETYDHHLHFPEEHYSLVTAPLAWLISLSLLFCACNEKVTNFLLYLNIRRTLRTLGMLTFPLYLLHNNFGLSLLNYFYNFMSERWYAAGMSLMLCLGISYYVYSRIEPPVSRGLQLTLRMGARYYREFKST